MSILFVNTSLMKHIDLVYFEHFQLSCCICIREELFENPDAGASTGAPKVLVLFTDGDASDRDSGIIEKYDKKKITRFVVAVSCCIINVLTDSVLFF